MKGFEFLSLFVHQRDNSVVDMSTWYLEEAPVTVVVQRLRGKQPQGMYEMASLYKVCNEVCADSGCIVWQTRLGDMSSRTWFLERSRRSDFHYVLPYCDLSRSATATHSAIYFNHRHASSLSACRRSFIHLKGGRGSLRLGTAADNNIGR
jgi:hypothetical protein